MSNVLLAASHVVLLVDEEKQFDGNNVRVVHSTSRQLKSTFAVLAQEGTSLEIFSVYDIFHYDENGTHYNENGTFYPVSQIYFLQR